MQPLENQLDSGSQNQKGFDVGSALLGDIWAPGAKGTSAVPQDTTGSTFVPQLAFTSLIESADKPPDLLQPLSDVVSNQQLVDQLGSDSFRRREAAMQELQQRGLCALPELLRAHDNSDLEISRRASQVVDRIGAAGLPFLVAALRGDDAQLRAGAERGLARLPLSSILDYAAENNDPQRLQDARSALGAREGWQDEISSLITRDSETGRFGPGNEQEFRRAIAGARLLDNQQYVFHLSLDEGRFLLDRGNHQGGLDALDMSLNTLERRLAKDPTYVLFAVDFQQQLRDHLESPAGQQLPQATRAAINQRIERAQALQEARQSMMQPVEGK